MPASGRLCSAGFQEDEHYVWLGMGTPFELQSTREGQKGIPNMQATAQLPCERAGFPLSCLHAKPTGGTGPLHSWSSSLLVAAFSFSFKTELRCLISCLDEDLQPKICLSPLPV